MADARKQASAQPTRRGAFGALKRLFKGQSDGPFFLGLQVVINSFGEDDLRRRLVDLITGERVQDESPEEKGRFIRRASALLMEFEPFWTYGYWDYVDDDGERAITEYRAWTGDIKAGMALDTAEVGKEADGLHRLSSDRKYVAVSLLFLMDRPYTYGEINDEDLFFKRTTFRLLIENLVRIEPGNLQADAAFVVPGNADDGLSDDDLLDEGWAYLRELWG
jgi:hypothetical protein